MSHPEQLGFFSIVAGVNQPLVVGGSVLEIGSYDVNGSVRQIFAGAGHYTGVDLVAGPGVDIVAYGHELDFPDGHFDAVISGECFEHDLHWRETFANMVRMTRPGGLVASTCAAKGRPEHGTQRTGTRESPGTQSRGIDYYHNLSSDEFRAAMDLEQRFSAHEFWYLPTSFDLYFAGVVRGEASDKPTGSLPDAHVVDGLRSRMSVPHKIARLPLRAAAGVLNERRYQQVVLPYWQSLLAVQDRLAGGHFRRAQRP